MSRGIRKLFTFQVWYFKPSGKFYSEAEYEYKCATAGGTDSPYMADAVASVRGLRDAGGQGAMPGLCSAGWDGYILVNHPEGFPCLITPPGEKK